MTLDPAYPPLTTSGIFVNTERVLRGSSTASTQNPTGTDSALQIEFGIAQNSASDPVMIDALGNITFNDAGSYFALIDFQFGRTGASGTSILFGRFLADGAQVFNSVEARLENANNLSPVEFHLEFPTIAATTVFTFEIIRDSTGNDSGGLVGSGSLPTAAGWTTSASSTIDIFRRLTA